MKFSDMKYADGVPVVEHVGSVVYAVTPYGDVTEHTAPVTIRLDVGGVHKVETPLGWYSPLMFCTTRASAIKKACEVLKAKTDELQRRLSETGGAA